MSGLAKILAVAAAAIVVASVTAACGTQHIGVAKSSPVYAGAVLFSQRCSGCHTLSYAGTNGSAPNIRSAQANSGPNFNVRCERPVTRVLYAIQNGGFSGAYMPQNIVVGQDAIDVAKFVATYAGRAAPKLTGVSLCQTRPLGTLPSNTGQPVATTAASTTTAAAAGGTTTAASTTTVASASAAPAKKAPAKRGHAGKRSRKKSAHS